MDGDLDGLIRGLVWLVLLVGTVSLGLGGHWPRLSGAYEEDGQAVTLGHLGPFVWGEAQVMGGYARYFGLVAFGRLRLRRYDRGALHLKALGFDPAHVPSLEGACTGTFVFRAAPNGDLVGAFVGRRFQAQGARMVAVGRAAPTPRHWRRAAH